MILQNAHLVREDTENILCSDESMIGGTTTHEVLKCSVSAKQNWVEIITKHWKGIYSYRN